jgi:hypothetical protein
MLRTQVAVVDGNPCGLYTYLSSPLLGLRFALRCSFSVLISLVPQKQGALGLLQTMSFTF